MFLCITIQCMLFYTFMKYTVNTAIIPATSEGIFISKLLTFKLNNIPLSLLLSFIHNNKYWNSLQWNKIKLMLIVYWQLVVDMV